MINWPQDKKFAFTIFDDTDNARLEDVKLVYDFLLSLDIKTTKSVWVLPPSEKPRIGGADLSDPLYRHYVQYLAKNGVEIGLHNASATHTKREKTITAFETFNDYIGYYPRSFANHADNRENIYWGGKRLSGIYKEAFEIFKKQQFEGEVKESDYYWGDIAKQHLHYIRNFVFSDLNTFKEDPYTPYFDATKPFVKSWFSSSNGATIKEFNDLVTPDAIDKLEAERGYSIVYTHFCSFVKNGELNPTFIETMEYLSKKNVWLVPVSTLLDYIAKQRGKVIGLNYWKRKKLETRWLYQQAKEKLSNR